MDENVATVIREKIQEICTLSDLPPMDTSFEVLGMDRSDVLELAIHMEDELGVWLEDYEIDYDPKCLVREFILFVEAKILE